MHPSWAPETARRWAVIIGEIVHDLRSSLDHMVYTCVGLSGGEPGREHAFPILKHEPPEGFAVWATAPRQGRRQAGKLFGLDRGAVDLIASFQPFARGPLGTRLALLDTLWQADKHRIVLQIVLATDQPRLVLRDCDLRRRDEVMRDGVLVIEVSAEPPARTQWPKSRPMPPLTSPSLGGP